MAERDITPEVAISKTQRRCTVGYLPNRSDTPVIKISAKWLREAGFEIGTGVTVKISEGCLILLADNNEVQELRRELYQVKQSVKGMPGVDGVPPATCDFCATKIRHAVWRGGISSGRRTGICRRPLAV